ncbi:MAG: hypothetical protein F9K29_06355 [Hyphomicrobiaceae bacterium]|nr:MAG: hypothetical protein F9K29_06355 [Hyphomicrobiaceae bacterium]
MNTFDWAWQFVRQHREEVPLLLGSLTAAYILYGIARAGNFISEVAFDQREGWFSRTVNWLRGIGRAMLLSWYAPTLLLAFPRRRFIGARYYTELQILQPRAALPHRRDYNEREYRRRLDEALEAEEARRQNIRRLLRERLTEEPGVVVAVVQWLFRKLRRAHGQEQPLGPVDIGDFPQLDDSRAKIKRYFEALERRSLPRGEDTTRFLTEARFQSGYIAPIFLITGLVNRFAEDDGWNLVLDNYRRLIEKDAFYTTELRELRSFLFNCWLLWGPSIQPCSCEQWAHGESANSPRDLMIQYGYGDENNSIDILVKGGLAADFRAKLHAILNKRAADQLNKPFNVSAAPFVATGRFRWGPSLSDAEVCTAQALVRGGSDAGQRQPINGRLVLECRHNDVTVAADVSQSSGYYSAYLWVMFLIQDAQGNCFHDEQWKNLLVFFEHGNIADASTYHTLKEQLVAKTCSTLAKVLSEFDAHEAQGGARRGPLRLAYACAFDDSNCTGHKALFPPDSLGRSSPAGAVAFEDVRILSILRRTIGGLAEGHVLRSDRLLLPAAAGPADANPYSSCHLPEIVEQFYADLVSQA